MRMPLLGPGLLVVLGVVSLVLPVAAVLLWDRMPGPRPLRAGGRIGLVVAAQLVAVLLAAAAVNDYAYFFTSWSDFLPSHRSFHSSDGSGSHGSGAPAPAAVRVGAPPWRDARSTGWSVPSEWSARGAVVAVQLTGALRRLAPAVDAYLPPAYFAGGRGGRGSRAMPLVEVFAAAGQPAADLIYRTPYPSALLSAIAAGRSAPMALVLVPGAAAGNPAGECAGRRSVARASRALPDRVAMALRLRPTRYAAVGAGSGGYCPLELALRAPGRFRAAASLASCYVGEGAVDAGLVAGLGNRLAATRPPAAMLLVPGGGSGGCGAPTIAALLPDVRAPTCADQVPGPGLLPGRSAQPLLRWTLGWLSQRLRADRPCGGTGGPR
ncbi:MAG: hypothetical protein ACJ74O_13025 [Frankiaceae bacterium]